MASERNVTPGITPASGPLAALEVDILVISATLNGKLNSALSELDKELGGALHASIDDGSFKGRTFETEWVYPTPAKAKRVMLVGTGKQDEYDLRIFRRVVAAAVRQCRNRKATRVALALEAPAGVSAEVAAQTIADAVATAMFDSDLYKAGTNKTKVEDVLVWSEEEQSAEALERGVAIGEAVNFGRWLGDEPSNVMTPERFATEVSAKAAELGVEYEVLDGEALKSAEMGSLLSVSRGSALPPRVVVLSYRGGGDGQTVAFVGKGVTFDTGGISIKPAADMHYMKYDMCGAAAAVSAVLGLAALKAHVNVLGVVGLVENMPSSTATRPGDVVRAANGKTIEIINTDAEGRLVLADVLDLARKRGADRLVDLATLTGAMKVALGTVATGAMGKPQQWVDAVLQAAERAGERVWQMPLFPEYSDLLKSNIADMMNTGGRFGGALAAGAFLQHFVGDTPWVHLDIAGTAYTDKDTSWQMKGATGAMIRTMIELAAQET